MTRFILIFSSLILLCACQPSLSENGKLRPFERTPFFAGQSSARPWPEGVVTRAEPIDNEPPPSEASIRRGQVMFQIYCKVCHGINGQGDGMAVERGFPRPPNFLDERLLQAPTSHFYQVITGGFGRMFSYANRISQKDRWAIAQYVRTLQLQQHFPAEALNAEEKLQLKEAQ